MMLFHPLQIDERTQSTTRFAAAIWLGVTQLLLVGVIFYRLYVLGQPDEEIRDFQAVLAISLFGYLALQLFLGGVMPVPTWKGAVLFYVLLSGAIAAVCLAIYGWPQPDQWTTTWLPTLLGPALLIGAYVLVARLGRWRMERQLERLQH
jgi:phosphoglycerol transferase MdoB-like AlkP superfamily enzyme